MNERNLSTYAGAPSTAPSEASGQLIVFVYTGTGALPVPDAIVTVTGCDEDGDGKRDAIAHLVTDITGNTPKITVPVAKPHDSPYPYADCSNYVVRVFHAGYYPVAIGNIHVYENITSMLPVPLIPVMEHETNKGLVTFRSPNKIYSSNQEEGDDCHA